MIILVETYDVKKANKLLPRTTVLDKIRSDFAAKTADRCFAVINPIKSESRSAESWRGLITRIRHLMLTAYDRTLSRFEDIIREQRERRNNPNWNFCHYFLLQEELVFELNHYLRFLLVECKASLLDLRSYLNNNNDNLE
ncbi:trafficking protein particle complex subunit 10-like [Ooceraea biroi]|uniref:trafficking protein particle complex subunit 10-like n=1 Tax=Ooceraea biroi TaxID=2015173 RepID=UPI000F077346|nr:trafficking protein particle complex subunit 10-like [Ooceraea biroi]XP_026828103.1 trafficking protein particle complex subunit 10-like [Ooceraea biroi]